MRGGHRDSQPSGAFRHGRIPDGGDQKTIALQRPRQVDRLLFTTDYPGMNGAAGFVSVTR
jgi:hypothetical protein